MKRFLLDTKPAQDFNNNVGVRQRADVERQRGHRIGICMPVLGELWAGIEGGATREDNLRRLRHGLSRLLVWPFDEAAAIEFGRVFNQLKRLGRPMQQNPDCRHRSVTRRHHRGNCGQRPFGCAGAQCRELEFVTAQIRRDQALERRDWQPFSHFVLP
jgi:tRNA(fMet)-specific endonuclease VapC